MPAGVEVFVEDGFAEITVPDPALRAEVLRDILAATPAALVEKDTRKGKYVVYRIPVGNATVAGLIDGDEKSGVIPLKADTGYAEALVEAEPFEKHGSKHGGNHGDWHVPSNTVADQAYQAMPSTGNGVVTQEAVNNPVPDTTRNGKIRADLRPNKNTVEA